MQIFASIQAYLLLVYATIATAVLLYTHVRGLLYKQL